MADSSIAPKPQVPQSVVVVPKGQSVAADASGAFPPQFSQQLAAAYEQQNGVAVSGKTAEELGLSITDAGQSASGDEQYVLHPSGGTADGTSKATNDVSGGNGQNAGLASDPVGGTQALSPQTQAVTSSPEFKSAVDMTAADASDLSGNFIESGLSSLLGAPGVNVQAIVQQVLMQAYQGNQKDLTRFADQVNFANKVKDALRQNEDKANNALSRADSNGNLAPGDSFKVPKDPSTTYSGDSSNLVQYNHDFSDGNPEAQLSNDQKAGTLTSTNSIQAYVQSIDNKLQSVGADQQQAQLQLQTYTQNSTQLMSMMSNLIKTYGDVSSSIIRNIL